MIIMDFEVKKKFWEDTNNQRSLISKYSVILESACGWR